MLAPRFVSFSAENRAGYGLAVEGGIIDLSRRF